MTYGLEVLVHEVMAAMATMPWSSTTRLPSARTASTGLEGRSPSGPTLTLTGWSLGLLSAGAAGSDAGKDSALASSMPPSVTTEWPLPVVA